MVFQDISVNQDSKDNEIAPLYFYRGALVIDRILSVLIDFLLFSPVIALAFSGVVRDLKTYLLYDENSNDAAMLWIFVIASAVVLSFALQVISTVIFGGTPGQKFLALKIYAGNSLGRFEKVPTFAQVALRYLFWWGSVLTFGIPFIEILGHPQRRAIHDRASETAVMSFGKYFDSGPLVVETRFIRSWLQVFASLVFCFLLAGMFKFYQSIQNGEYSQKVLIQNQNYCRDLDKEVLGEKRADQLFALLVSDDNKVGCVSSEAEALIWTPNHILRSWGYLILANIPTLENSANYATKICEGAQGSEPCLLSQFLNQKPRNGDQLRSKGLATVSSRFFLLKNELESKNYSSVFSLLNDLKSEAYLSQSLEKINVKAVWEVQQKVLTSVRSRNPASTSEEKSPMKMDEKEFQDILSSFKERYNIQ